MAQMTIPSDVYIAGNLSAATQTFPAGSVTDATIAGAAGIQASKLQQQHEPVYSQVSTANAANDQKVLHAVKGATGTLIEFAVGAVTAYGAASSCVVDLLKNGASILTGTITLDNTTAAFILKLAPGFTSPALVAGDILEVKVSGATGANPAKGLFARLTVREAAQ